MDSKHKDGRWPEGHAIWWVTPDLFDDHPDFRAATLAWLRGLGLNPDRLAPVAGITPWQGGFELHVDEVVAAGSGRDRIDPLKEDALLTIRQIVPVDEGSWPAMPMEVAV